MSIAAGVYDIIVDRHADQMARCRMFDTLVMLVADGRLDHEAAAAFVRECFDKLMPRDESMVWLGWVEAVALLGMAELGPRVRKAIDNFWVPAGLMEFEDFEQQLITRSTTPMPPGRATPISRPSATPWTKSPAMCTSRRTRRTPSGSATWMIRSSTNTTFHTSSLW